MTPRSALGLPLLAVLAFLLPLRAAADVAATGSFDIALTGGLPPNVSFDGEIRFDAGARTVLGASGNMAEDVGEMRFDGDAVVDLIAERVSFDLTADSDGEFAFDASGAASCDNPGCLNGSGNFAGRLTPNDPDDVLPDDGVFTFDGTAAMSAQGQGLNGVFAINAFRSTATPAGTDVTVSTGLQPFWDTIADEERTFRASALFTNVTVAGSTQFVAFSAFPNAFPAGITANGAVSVFVDVSTMATFTDGVWICLGYPDANDDDIVDGTVDLSVLRLRLLHAATADAAFTDVTDAIAAELVCGNVQALGRVALGVGPAEGSTTTTIVETSTTTSLAPGVTTTSTTPTPSATSLPPGATTTTSTVPGGETTTSTTVSPGAGTTTSTTLPSGASTTTSTTLASGRSTTTTVGPGGSTTTSTLPLCVTALECLGVAIAGPLCPGETVNPKLSTLILKKLAKAQTALLAARSADSARKVARLVKKARRQVDKVAGKAGVFVSKPKGAISTECRDRILAATGRVAQQIDANRL